MAQTVLITLTTAGADTGPFRLLSDADGYVNPFQTGVSKSALLAGFVSVIVPDGATIIRVQSDSAYCGNFIDLPIGGTPPTTTTTSSSSSTTTTTTTAPPTTTTTTTLAPNTFNGMTGIVQGNGTNVNSVSLGGFGFTYAPNPIAISSGAPSTVTGQVTVAPNTSPLAITLNSGANKTIGSNTLVLRDTTTSTDYPGVVTGNGTPFVTISFAVALVSGHVFQITGQANFTGG